MSKRTELECECPLRHRRHRHMLYRCPACKRWRCGYCDGADDEDFRFCDDCSAKRRRRRERRSAHRC